MTCTSAGHHSRGRRDAGSLKKGKGSAGAASLPTLHQALLQLQSSAGNRAVTALLTGEGPSAGLRHHLDHGTHVAAGMVTFWALSRAHGAVIAEEQAPLQRQDEQERQPVTPIPPITVVGKEAEEVAHANRRLPPLRGKTTARFRSTSTTPDLTTEEGSACKGCRGPSCVHVTGTLVSEFTVETTVTLPRPPRGLPECEREQVQDAIDTTLASHEQEHVTAFETYNGTVEAPIELTTCRWSVQGTVQKVHTKEERKRRKEAKAASAALDPFDFNYTIDPCGE